MDEQGFVILKREGKTPTLAKCAGCQLKFFTLSKFIKDPLKAEAFLWNRYAGHLCRARMIGTSVSRITRPEARKVGGIDQLSSRPGLSIRE